MVRLVLATPHILPRDVKVTAECQVVTHVFELKNVSPPSMLAKYDDISITCRLRSVV